MHLKEERYTYKDIQERMAEEGTIVTIKTLYLLVAKYRKTMTVADRHHGILKEEHYIFFDQQLLEDDELTAHKAIDEVNRCES